MKLDLVNLEGEINLSSAHSIIIGNKPDKVKVQSVVDKLNGDNDNTLVQSYGLFDTASPNYSTYYPDVKKEDLNPGDDEFINPVFRLLSETIVYKGIPIDFSRKGVLKKSMPMLLGQTINIDHEIAVGNAIGAISDTFWQNSYKTQSGVVVPAGINGVLKIDGKSNPRIARGIMMEPPSIHSNSVTVKFRWEPSHEFDEAQEFYDKVGTFNEDGELIRLVVNEITTYSETSLVSHGADVWAQRVKENGQINNPTFADDNYKFSADKPIRDAFSIDYKDLKSLSLDTAIPKGSNNNKTKQKGKDTINMKKFIETFLATFVFGTFEKDEVTEENFTEKITGVFTAKQAEIDALKLGNDKKDGTISDLEADITTKETEITQLGDNKEAFDKIVGNTQKEAIKLYKLAKGDKVEDSIVDLISKADLALATSFANQYKDEADSKFEATCNDCKSTNVSRASAKTTSAGLVEDGKEEGNTPAKEKDSQEVLGRLRSKRKNSIFFANQELGKNKQ